MKKGDFAEVTHKALVCDEFGSGTIVKIIDDRKTSNGRIMIEDKNGRRDIYLPSQLRETDKTF